MKRSVIVGTTALVAGLLLAITAFAAPFRSYDRAAHDQYTTTVTTTTTVTDTAPTPTTGVAGQGTGAPAPNSVVEGAGQGGGTTTPAADDDGTGTTPDEDDSDAGNGTRPDVDRGNGPKKKAATNRTGAGTGSGLTGDCRLAYLFVGEQPRKLPEELIKITGIPVWAAQINVDLDPAALASLISGKINLRKIRDLGRRMGASSVPATPLVGRLPDLVDVFQGEIEPICALILARTKIADNQNRRQAETFQRAFAIGAERQDIPVIGTELNRTKPSSIPYFKTIKDISSVDDIGTQRGAISLTRLLAGAKQGHYGRRKGADAPTPPTINPAPAAALADGGGSLGGSPLLVGLLLTMALLGGRALVTVTQRARSKR